MSTNHSILGKYLKTIEHYSASVLSNLTKVETCGLKTEVNTTVESVM